ncbi:DUF7525 family protein [Halococcoides cellulosivorans]|uniref:DUF7525 family protein n=1 Tax=Halococcoides cellulosivorans TaxID=1679096 RepID=UPI001571B972|nr:hypothetical protein [Halococcoides cellulosivorans]
METQTDRPVGIALAGLAVAALGAGVMAVAAADNLIAGGGFALAVAAGVAAIVAVQTLA